MEWVSTEGKDVTHRPLTPQLPTSHMPAGRRNILSWPRNNPANKTPQAGQWETHTPAKETPPQPRTLTCFQRTFVQNDPFPCAPSSLLEHSGALFSGLACGSPVCMFCTAVPLLFLSKLDFAGYCLPFSCKGWQDSLLIYKSLSHIVSNNKAFALEDESLDL